MTARFVRDSPAMRMKSLRIDSSASRSRIRAPVAPPARPVAITGRPSSFSARATFTPFPPATVLASTARCRRPRRKFGTATVRSIAAFRVTVRITLSLSSGRGAYPPRGGHDDDGQREPGGEGDRAGRRRPSSPTASREAPARRRREPGGGAIDRAATSGTGLAAPAPPRTCARPSGRPRRTGGSTLRGAWTAIAGRCPAREKTAPGAPRRAAAVRPVVAPRACASACPDATATRGR